MKTFSKKNLIAMAILAISSCGSNDNDSTNPCATLNSPIVQAMAPFINSNFYVAGDLFPNISLFRAWSCSFIVLNID